MNLTDKALLVQLSISQWTARKFDKKVTDDVAVQHDAVAKAGSYYKALLPMSEELARVHKLAAGIRQQFYHNTLPWGIEGTMMLPSANYLPFMTQFRGEKAKWEATVQTFYDAYSNLVEQAKTTRGDMYNAKDYPALYDVQRKFSMDLWVGPVPSDDFRVAVPEDELAQIQADVKERVTTAGKMAMTSIWERLYEKVQWLADRLSDPHNTFNTGTYGAMLELCELIPRLNFADDPNLTAICQRVRDQLASFHPDTLRNDPDVRQQVSRDAADILSKMRVFMGATT